MLLLYALPHLVLYARLRPLLPRRAAIPALLALLALMASFFVGFGFRGSPSPVLHAVQRIGYGWMAFLFWTFCAGLLVDACRIGRRLIPAARRPPPFGPRGRLAVVLLTASLAFAWGLAEGRSVRVRTVTVPGLAASRPLRLALVTDLHLSPVGNRAAASRALALLEAAEPDLILSGGDLVDAPPEAVAADLARLRALDPPLGKYAVLGNHEYYVGLEAAQAAHAAAGFRLLRETRVPLLPGLILAGVDDRDGGRVGAECRADEEAALPEAGTDACVILLKHRPTVSPTAERRADLQLSGHTHGGQIFPFHGLVRLLFPRLQGLHRVSDRLHLYVSRGAGTWGPPLRLGARPEIVLLTIPGPG